MPGSDRSPAWQSLSAWLTDACALAVARAGDTGSSPTETFAYLATNNPVTVDLLEVCRADPHLRRFDETAVVVAATGGQWHLPIDQLIRELLWTVLTAHGTPKERIALALDELWEFVTEPDAEVTLFAPVPGLRAERAIMLSTDLTFQMLPSEFSPPAAVAGRMYSDRPNWGFVRLARQPRWSSAPNYSELGQTWLPSRTAFTNAAEQAMLALAVVRHGETHLDYVASAGPTWIERPALQTWRPHWRPSRTAQDEFIDMGDAAKWIDVLASLSAIDFNRYAFLRLSLERFADAQRGGSDGQRVIDLAISAEALFLPGGRDELSYRLSTRAAVWLAEPMGRPAITQAFGALYAARSRLVHGSPPGKKDDLSEIARTSETHMRTALQLAINWCADGRAPGGAGGLFKDWDTVLLAGRPEPWRGIQAEL